MSLVLVDKIWKIKRFLYQKYDPSITYQKCNPCLYESLTHVVSTLLTTFSALSYIKMKKSEGNRQLLNSSLTLEFFFVFNDFFPNFKGFFL